MGDIILDAMMIGNLGKAATNCVLVNGGFETGDLSGWTSQGNVQTISGGAAEGAYYCRIESATGAIGMVRQQMVCVPAGQTLSYTYKLADVDTARVQFNYANMYGYHEKDLVNAANWTDGSFTMANHPEVPWVCISFYGHVYDPPNYRLEVDNISLV